MTSAAATGTGGGGWGSITRHTVGQNGWLLIAAAAHLCHGLPEEEGCVTLGQGLSCQLPEYLGEQPPRRPQHTHSQHQQPTQARASAPPSTTPRGTSPAVAPAPPTRPHQPYCGPAVESVSLAPPQVGGPPAARQLWPCQPQAGRRTAGATRCRQPRAAVAPPRHYQPCAAARRGRAGTAASPPLALEAAKCGPEWLARWTPASKSSQRPAVSGQPQLTACLGLPQA